MAGALLGTEVMAVNETTGANYHGLTICQALAKCTV